MFERKHQLRRPYRLSTRFVNSGLIRFGGSSHAHHSPHRVMLIMIFCSVKNSSMSHVVEGHDAMGVLQVSGSGEPDVMSAGMLARWNCDMISQYK